MLIAILSDIHSNLPAFQKVREELEGHESSIDKYVCLGDIVGYGANPDECCDIARDLFDVVVVGNHDAAVSGRMDYSYYYDAAREALDWHSAQTSEENREWLESLPYRVDEDDVSYCHGSPINLEEFDYVFNLHQANQLIDHWDELNRVTYIGHSHLTKSFRLHREEGARELEPPVLEFEDDEDVKYIVTVGSVGQPRDNDNRACYGLFDTDEETFEFNRVEYDVREAARRIFDSELSSDFAKRLFFGI